MLGKDISIFAIATLALWPAPAWSDTGSAPEGTDDRSSCGTAYEQAQEARSDGRLRLARQQLEICVKAECPEFVRADCDRWLGEVESTLPTVVLAATRGGVDVSEVRVSMDDEPLAERLDGKAVGVDPGRHRLTFVTAGGEEVVIDVVIREGEKNRPIVARFEVPEESPSTAPEVPPAESPRETSRRGPLPYVLGGVGVLGVTGFAVLGALGNQKKNELERDCAPNCGESEVASVRTKYHLADASLALGAIALGVGGYLYFSAPSRRTSVGAATARSKHGSRSESIAVDVTVTGHGAIGTMRARF